MSNTLADNIENEPNYSRSLHNELNEHIKMINNNTKAIQNIIKVCNNKIYELETDIFTLKVGIVVAFSCVFILILSFCKK